MRSGRNIVIVAALGLSGLLALSGCQGPTEDAAPTGATEEGSAVDTPAPPGQNDEATSAADEEDDNAEPSGADVATPRPGVASEEALEDVAEGEAADAIITPVITEQHRALQAPAEPDWGAVVAVAGGSLLDSIDVAVMEYAELDWAQVGTPELVSSTVLELQEDATPPTAQVEICLDHSAVDVVDPDGVSVLDEKAETRVKSMLTLDYVDGRWVAIAQDFADELSC